MLVLDKFLRDLRTCPCLKDEEHNISADQQKSICAMLKIRNVLAGTFLSLLANSNADATTLLVFGQVGTASTVSATNPSPSTTRISANDVAVTITTMLDGPQTPFLAFLNLQSSSTGPATQYPATTGSYFEPFSGSFSITAAIGGAGTNYLSGSFSDIVGALGSSATLRSTTPSEIVSFTSDVIPMSALGDPKGIAFSFSDVIPAVASLCGPAAAPTLCGFSANISGNFSATSVPEPLSLILLGTALCGVGVLRHGWRGRTNAAAPG